MIIVVLILLGLSYLSPDSYFAWYDAQQDFFATLSLITLLYSLKQKIFKISKSEIIIFFILILVPTLQFVTGKIYFTQDFILTIFYILIFCFSVICGSNYLNWNKDKDFWYIAFILYGLISVFIELLQIYLSSQSIFVRNGYTTRAFANLGQPNQLSTLLIISYISNIILYFRKKTSNIVYLIINVILLAGIVLTQSRTSWLIFTIFPLIAILKKDIKLFKILTINSFMLFSFVSFISYINEVLYITNQGFTERFHSQAARPIIWKQMLIAISQEPLFGYGWHQTQAAQVLITPYYSIKLIILYSHNLFIDLLVWNGVPLGMLFIGIIMFVTIRMFIRVCDSENLLLFLILTAFGIHSLLEYPFAYAYFIFPIGLIFGILNYNLADIKKIYLCSHINYIFGSILLISLTIVTWEYLDVKNKNAKYAEENLFSNTVTPIVSNVRLLDNLDLQTDIIFLKSCYVLQNYSHEDLKHAALNLPTNKNLKIFYQSSVYNNYDSTLSINLLKFNYSGDIEGVVLAANKELNECKSIRVNKELN